MARLEFALLCHSALLHGDGLVSILGAGLGGINVPPSLPTTAQVTAVMLVAWEESDLNEGHTSNFAVTDPAAELVAEMRTTTVPVRLPKSPPGPIKGIVILPLPIFVRRFGEYTVKFILDRKTVLTLPLQIMALRSS